MIEDYSGAGDGEGLAYSIHTPGKDMMNYAIATLGPLDDDNVLLPVSVYMISSTTAGVANVAGPVAGINYENPAIGQDSDSCTNHFPTSWMGMMLQAEVYNLTIGTNYNLYRYEFGVRSGESSDPPLAVPTKNFNQNEAFKEKITFTSVSRTYVSPLISTTSDKIQVFRCVPASAP